jgi:LacI family transcriptional regulator
VEPVPLLYQLLVGCVNSHNAAPSKVSQAGIPGQQTARGDRLPDQDPQRGGEVKKAPTIRDVASAAGVSVSVVSRVLNPESGPVAPAKRETVLRVIDELGYRPRAAARELSVGQTPTIGLVVADLANPFFAKLADRVVWEASSHGVKVMLMTTKEDPNN